MKIVCISDTHTRHQDVDLPKGDILIHAGDISLVGIEYQVINFLEWFSKQEFKYKMFISGNHDFMFERNPTQVQQLIPEKHHLFITVQYYHRRIKVLWNTHYPYFWGALPKNSQRSGSV